MTRVPVRLGALALTLAVSVSLTARAETAAPTVLVDAGTGEVLQSSDATRPWHPASTTKLMTAYVALRAVQAGTLGPDTPLIASARASAQPPSKIGIRPGQEITLDNALKILMVKSANDIAVVVAEGVGGSVEGFAAMMNAEARRLGMRESHFVNPHGLHDSDQQSSARDLAVLALAIMRDFPTSEYFSIGAVQLGQRVMKNTNGLIGRYDGAMGMKTGFICPSGFNVVASARRGGRTLIAVVLGAGSAAERTVRTANLLDQGFAGGGIFGFSGSRGPSLQALPSSAYSSAPNMRQEICRRGRKIPLGEVESDGPVAYTTQSGDDRAAMSFVLGTASSGPQAPQARRVGARAASGRVVLGPRAPLETIPVYLGRAPGSTAVARGPGAAPRAPENASAFAASAPQPPPRAAEEPRQAQAAEADAAPEATAAPMPLPGAITAGRRTPVAAPRESDKARIAARPAAVRAAATGAAAEDRAGEPKATAVTNPPKAPASAAAPSSGSKASEKAKAGAKAAKSKAANGRSAGRARTKPATRASAPAEAGPRRTAATR